jgi:hypothetical protein
MAIWQRFAGLIWAAIFVVALQLVPTAARAHGGHDHHPSHQHLSQHHQAQPSAAATKQAVGVHRGDDAVDASRTAVELKAPASVEGAFPASAACVGGCCSGMGCCSAAAIAAAGPPLPQHDGSADAVAFQGTRPGGTRPEGLMKPPRTLA